LPVVIEVNDKILGDAHRPRHYSSTILQLRTEQNICKIILRVDLHS